MARYRKTRPDKPEGWDASPRTIAEMRTKIERGAYGAGGQRIRGKVSDEQFRAGLGDLTTRQTIARQMAAGDKHAYRNAMQQLRRYASGQRGTGVPESVKRRVADQARKVNQAGRVDKIRNARRVRIKMVTDATISAKSRDNFGPGYSGAGLGAEIDPSTFAEALERGDTWSIMAMAYEDYWPGSEDAAIYFEDVQDVEIIIDE
jgi:hypothetical protein